MRNLLWKDFWQNSRILLAVSIFVAIPYLVILGSTLGEKLLDGSPPTTSGAELTTWAEAIKIASAVGLGLSILMAAFIGGNAIAGERADRSAEFAAGLPIRRGEAVTSKALVAAVACLAMWAINAAVWLIARQVQCYVQPDWHPYGHGGEELLILPICLIGTVALFGLSWLYSSLVQSPATAAAAAIGTAVGFLMAVLRLGDAVFRGPAEPSFALWVSFYVVVLILGLLSFVAGTVVCRRRVEPWGTRTTRSDGRKRWATAGATVRGLLWKDFRQNGWTLLGVAIIAAAPYAVSLVVAAWGRLFWSSGPQAWAEAIMAASFMSMALSVLLAAFIGGNAIAGEREDRSAEFAAGLPIGRGKAVTSKATVAIASCLAIWAFNAAVVTVFSRQRNFRVDTEELVLICLTFTMLLFGLSWLYSSLLKSRAISAAAAIGTAIGLVLIIQTVTNRSFEDCMYHDVRGICFYVVLPIISLLSFAAGATICLKRVEP